MHYIDHLETERLMTRFLIPADVDIWIEYCSDPVATKFTSSVNKNPRQMAEDFIGFTLKRYAENRLGLQALLDKETGDFIGMCGVILQEVNGKNEIEVGYHLLPKHWGKGYATEAAQKFRDYGFEHLSANSIISLIAPLNLRSKQVAMRNGMTLTETVMFRDKETHLFRITREEWERIAKP